MNTFCDLNCYLLVYMAEFHIWVSEIHTRIRKADFTEQEVPWGLPAPEEGTCGSTGHGTEPEPILPRSVTAWATGGHLGYMCNCIRYWHGDEQVSEWAAETNRTNACRSVCWFSRVRDQAWPRCSSLNGPWSHVFQRTFLEMAERWMFADEETDVAGWGCDRLRMQLCG